MHAMRMTFTAILGALFGAALFAGETSLSSVPWETARVCVAS